MVGEEGIAMRPFHFDIPLTIFRSFFKNLTFTTKQMKTLLWNHRLLSCWFFFSFALLLAWK